MASLSSVPSLLHLIYYLSNLHKFPNHSPHAPAHTTCPLSPIPASYNSCIQHAARDCCSRTHLTSSPATLLAQPAAAAMREQASATASRAAAAAVSEREPAAAHARLRQPAGDKLIAVRAQPLWYLNLGNLASPAMPLQLTRRNTRAYNLNTATSHASAAPLVAAPSPPRAGGRGSGFRVSLAPHRKVKGHSTAGGPCHYSSSSPSSCSSSSPAFLSRGLQLASRHVAC